MPTSKQPTTPGRNLLMIGFVCMVAAGILGYRYFHQIRYRPLPRPMETNVSHIEGWMTLPYVARTYHVPLPYLFESLSIDDVPKNHNINLDNLAKLLGEAKSDFITRVRSAVTAFQSAP